MKFFTKFSAFFAGLLFTISAFGGNGGGGGGLGKTRLLLQTFEYDQAVLAYDGLVNIPESETAPRLVIPADEYTVLFAEAAKAVAPDSKPYVLKDVEMQDGSIASFTLLPFREGNAILFLYFVRNAEGRPPY